MPWETVREASRQHPAARTPARGRVSYPRGHRIDETPAQHSGGVSVWLSAPREGFTAAQTSRQQELSASREASKVRGLPRE